MSPEQIESEKQKYFQMAFKSVRRANDLMRAIDLKQYELDKKTSFELCKLAQEASCSLTYVERLIAGCMPPKKGD
jgi:hypothetical protein